MRSEDEIREELERVEKEIGKHEASEIIQSLNSRKWTLKWVLWEEE